MGQLSGRDLDRAVAERIFAMEANAPVPYFSSCISDAWIVVKELFKDQWCLGMQQSLEGPEAFLSESSPWYWTAYFSRRTGGDVLGKAVATFDADGTTAPEAICRAALIVREKTGHWVLEKS